jgi:hypothetical protein
MKFKVAVVSEPYDNRSFDAARVRVVGNPPRTHKTNHGRFGWRFGLDGVEEAVLEWGKEFEQTVEV